MKISNYKVDRDHLTHIFSFGNCERDVGNCSSEIFWNVSYIHRKTLVKYETILLFKNCQQFVQYDAFLKQQQMK